MATDLMHVYNRHPRSSGHTRVLTTTAVVAEITQEHSIVELNATLRSTFSLDHTPYARLDYACYPTEWLAAPRLPLKRRRMEASVAQGCSGGADADARDETPVAVERAEPVIRNSLYEVLVGDVVRVLPPSFAAQRRDVQLRCVKLERLYDAGTYGRPKYLPPALPVARCTLGIVLRIFPDTQQARILHLRSPDAAQGVGSPAAETAASAASRPDHAGAQSAPVPSDIVAPAALAQPGGLAVAAEPIRTAMFALSQLETEYDRDGRRALRVCGLDQCIRDRDRARAQVLLASARRLVEQCVRARSRDGADGVLAPVVGGDA